MVEYSEQSTEFAAQSLGLALIRCLGERLVYFLSYLKGEFGNNHSLNLQKVTVFYFSNYLYVLYLCCFGD